MEFVHEVTAYLENKPGRLAKICSALAHEKVDLKALSIMDSAEHSVLRFVTDDQASTKKALGALGVEFTVTEILAVSMDHQPGSLARVLERLAEEHINIDYAYASTASTPGKAVGYFHTSNSKRAQQILNSASANGVDRPGGLRRPLHNR